MAIEDIPLPFPPHECQAPAPVAMCDLSTQCGRCGGPMRPEHAHYRCTLCGERDSCCDGPY